ncbi:MAG TPA: alpha/beta hydrolase [Pseudonocardiaceae bacterium]
MTYTSRLTSRVPVREQAGALRLIFELPRPVRRLLAGRPVVREGQRLDSDVQLLLRLQKLAGYQFGGRDVAEARAALEIGSRMAAGPRVGSVSTRPVDIPRADGGIPARLYTPTGLAAGSPLLVYYHGGGCVLGSLDTHDALCRHLARLADVRLLAVDYRLAPEHPFPAGVDDAVAAFAHVAAHAEELGADPAALAVGGDSAGGNLAAVVAHQASQNGTARPVFALLLYPSTDASVRRPSRNTFGRGFFLRDSELTWFLNHYAPDPATHTDPRLSVLLADDLRGFPATYLATAGFDPLRDEGEAFAARLTEFGVRVTVHRQPDLVHGYAGMLAASSRCREAVAEAAGALRVGLALSRPKPRARRRAAASSATNSTTRGRAATTARTASRTAAKSAEKKSADKEPTQKQPTQKAKSAERAAGRRTPKTPGATPPEE